MMPKSENAFYFMRLFADLLMVSASFSIAAYFSDSLVANYSLDFSFLGYQLTVWYFSARSYNLYLNHAQGLHIREILNILNCIAIQAIAAILFIFVIKNLLYSRVFVALYGATLALLLPLTRLLVKQVFSYFYGRGLFCKRAIVIGDGVTGRRFFRYIQQNKFFGYDMVKYINGKMIIRANGSAVAKINNIAIGNGGIGQIDEVFVVETDSGEYDVNTITDILTGYAARLRVVPKINDMLAKGAPRRITMLGGFPLVSVRREPLEDVYNQAFKRVFDVFFSLFILIFVCSWLFPLIALAIKLSSKGPVFFKQERWGRRNKPFVCYKFRSMYTHLSDTDTSGTFKQATKGDARITPIGRILRKTNLDEFPQFFNVLLGHMSIVGPRPHASLMNLESVERINRYLTRHMAKPGITGWAQVNGLRGESSDHALLEARVAYDVWYIENWSFWLDIRIIFLTVFNMFVGDKHAY
ncbi:MAG: exopolysaccharide biosynthesis polyprenyl glycosylphosphotransferase [Pseudosphingobacterium sp.]|nr:exopolysaccharide biosynthesis polyprenyl glycosylphosphotransferase [Olivibacter sp. UJ_SKK_5.1]MDX3912670.1 exopolysaccharide biosynthesis polyprenyl glycosylphosphotransferase [Pseudosphingobacterium sp.]